MKQQIFKILFITLFIFSLFSCDTFHEIKTMYLISIQNCTDENLIVSLSEDPETRNSKSFGAYSFTQEMAAGQKITTNAITNDYYKITVNNNVIHPRYDTTFDKTETSSDDYHFFCDENELIKICKDELGYYYDF